VKIGLAGSCSGVKEKYYTIGFLQNIISIFVVINKIDYIYRQFLIHQNGFLYRPKPHALLLKYCDF